MTHLKDVFDACLWERKHRTDSMPDGLVLLRSWHSWQAESCRRSLVLLEEHTRRVVRSVHIWTDSLGPCVAISEVLNPAIVPWRGRGSGQCP